MSSRNRLVSVFLGIVGGLCALPLSAADEWREPVPGLRYLHRRTPEPKDIHALLIDLDAPGVRLRATRASERGRTVSDFSQLVGAAAAINGDFYAAGFAPIGLALGEGEAWEGSADTAGWSFLACSAHPSCEIDESGAARSVDPAWHSVVGGNHLLVAGGVPRSADDDLACGEFCTTPHPRTAVGLDESGRVLIWVVVEGRQTPLLGMSLARLAALMVELGAHRALNLDGGGSSAMVLLGTRVSDLPSTQVEERPVANHLALLYDEGDPSPPAPALGRLVGFVRGGDLYDVSAGLSGARVTLSSGASLLTDEQGYFAFEALAPGMVTLNAAHHGYLPAAVEREVVAGSTRWASVALQAALPASGPDGASDAGMEAPTDAGTRADAGTAPDASDGGSAPDVPLGADAASATGPEDASVREVPDAATNDAATNDAATNDAATNDAAANDAAATNADAGDLFPRARAPEPVGRAAPACRCASWEARGATCGISALAWLLFCLGRTPASRARPRRHPPR